MLVCCCLPFCLYQINDKKKVIYAFFIVVEFKCTAHCIMHIHIQYSYECNKDFIFTKCDSLTWRKKMSKRYIIHIQCKTFLIYIHYAERNITVLLRWKWEKKIYDQKWPILNWSTSQKIWKKKFIYILSNIKWTGNSNNCA